MTASTGDPIYDLASAYVVAVFPGEHDERTCAAGIFNEDGSALVSSIYDPDVIDAVAGRLKDIAAEIRENRSERAIFDNIVRGIDWGRHGPTQDL